MIAGRTFALPLWSRSLAVLPRGLIASFRRPPAPGCLLTRFSFPPSDRVRTPGPGIRTVSFAVPLRLSRATLPRMKLLILCGALVRLVWPA